MFGFGKSSSSSTASATTTSPSTTTSTTTTPATKKDGFIKRHVKSAWGCVKTGISDGLGKAFKLALFAGGVYGVERIVENTYEKVSGNEIKWQFKDAEGNPTFKVEHVDNPNVYVGERGSEFDDTFASTGEESQQISDDLEV